MNKKRIILISLIALLLIIITSLIGIIYDDGGKPFSVTSIRGEMVELYGGNGLYRYDTMYKAIVFIGYNWANLFVNLSLIIFGLIIFAEPVIGPFLLSGIYFYLFYNYLIGVSGNVYNELFLAWLALSISGGIGLVFILSRIDYKSISDKIRINFPRAGLLIFLIIVILFLVMQYLVEIIPGYINEIPPAQLKIYTTLDMAVFDLGIAVPLYSIGVVLLFKNKMLGYIITTILNIGLSLTFISLSVFAGINYLKFHRDGLLDMLIIILILIISTGFSVKLFCEMKGKLIDG